MKTRKFALIGGLVMLVMGVLALIPTMSPPSNWLPELKVMVSYGLFMGLFPMNIFNKLALIIFGLAGIATSRGQSINSAIYYSRTVFIVMGLAAVLGLIPGLNTLFGFWPLFGNEVIVHGSFAALGLYFGFFVSLPNQREISRA